MGWVSPTGFDDPDSKWQSEANAYDETTGTYSNTPAYTAAGSWSSYLHLTHAALTCSKLQIFPKMYYNGDFRDAYLDIQIYDGADWTLVYQGTLTQGEWTEKTFALQTVTAVKIAGYNADYSHATYIGELDFWEVIPVNVTVDAVLVSVDSQGLVSSLALDRIFSSPLVAIDSLAPVPIWMAEALALPPLVEVDSEALVTTLSLGVIFALPLIGVDSEGKVPTLVIDRIFSSPLIAIDAEALVASLVLDRIFSSPLVAIDSTTPLPVFILSHTMVSPLVATDSLALIPSLVIDRIFVTPLIVITSKAPTPFEPDTGHLTIVVPLTDIAELGFVPAVAAAIQRILIQATNLRVITSATKRAIQTPADLRKVDR